MSFENSAKAVSSELKKLQRYLEQGKYESMDFRGIASKLRGLAKAVSSTDEQATLLKLQGAYASLRDARANYDKSISTVADVVDMQAKVYKQEAKKLTKTAEEIAKNTKKFSDVYASVDQEAERIRPEKPEEEQLVINLVKSLVETRKYFDKDIKELTKKIRSGKKSSLNTSELETRLLNLKKQKEASIVSVINAGLAKEISRDRNANRFFKSGDTLESAITLLLDEIYGHSDEASIMEQIYNFQNAKNLGKKVKYKKVHDKGAQTQDRALVGLSGAWTALMSQSPEARNNRKAAGTIDSFLEWFLNQNKVFSSNKKNFKQFLFNAMHANLASMGLNMNSLDSNIQDTYGLMVATLRDILSSNNLADIYKESFGTNLKDPKKVGLDAMSILDDVNKTLAVFRRYTPLTDGFVIGSNNRLYTMASALEEITTTDNIPINPEDLKKYSAVLSLFGGLGVDKNTPAYVRMWKDNVSNYGVDLNNEWVYKLLSSGRGFHTFGPSEIESLIGPDNRRISLGDIKDYKRYTRRAEKDPDKASKGYGLVPIKSGLPDMYYGHSRRDTSEDRWRLTQFLMYWINNMMQRKLGGVGPAGLIGTASNFGSNAIVVSKQGSDYGGLNLPAVVPEVTSSDDSTLGSATKSIDKSKSASQKKQEAKDKKRQEQKSFIDLLIPALSKLLKKTPIWDVIKMLLFKLGATHPKTAAAFILGGAPLAFGAARLLTRGLLGIPNLGALTTGTSAATAGLTASKGPGVWSSITSNIRRVNARHAAYVRATKNVSNLGTGGPVMYIGPQGVASTSLHSARLGNYKNPHAHYGKAILDGTLKGFKNNAIANWAKYSKDGKFGTLGTLGRAAKGIPGLGALLEIISDVPAIMDAAKSGKKGALRKQLGSTTGAAVGAFAGAFLGPIGLLLGPLIGRGIGTSIGKKLPEITEAFGRLGSALIGLLNAIAKSPIGKALGRLSDAITYVAELFTDIVINAIVGVVKALEVFANALRYILDSEYRDEVNRGDGAKNQKTYIEKLQDSTSKEYRNIGNSAQFKNTLATNLGVRTEWDKLASSNKMHGGAASVGLSHLEKAYYDKRVPELISKGMSKKDAKSTAKAEFSAVYEKVYKDVVNSNISLAEEKIKNYETYGNVKGAFKYNKNTPGIAEADQYKKHYGSVVMGDKAHKITSGFGNRNKPTDKASSDHKGIDLEYSLGEAVKVSQGGKVITTGYDAAGYGNYAYVQDSSGFIHRYGHFRDSLAGMQGKTLNAGDTLGYAGSTGDSTGPHLHYEVRDAAGNVYDPVLYRQGVLKKMGGTSTSQLSTTSTNTGSKAIEQTGDDVRQSLLDFARATNAKNKKDTIDRIVWDTTDVTGSLGCWGIVQLNNTGQMVH